MPDTRVAVIGAGISGLACARSLTIQGCSVVVFEKSRGLGGRMATRRAMDDATSFDHGAQYFTCSDERFRALVESWCQQGIAAPWNGPIVAWENGEITQKFGTERFVAVPGMNAIAKSVATGLDIFFNCRVGPPRREDDRWVLETAGGDLLNDFEVVVVSAPAGQTVELLSEAGTLARRAAKVNMSGCWAVMLALETPIDCQFDGAFVHNSPLSWIARNSSKPGREQSIETWVLHASPEWSEKNLATPAPKVEETLLEEFQRVVGTNSDGVRHQDSRLWRFALPQEPLPESCLFDEELRIGACGDWCGGPRVEGAFLSGLALAERIMKTQVNSATATSYRVST